MLLISFRSTDRANAWRMRRSSNGGLRLFIEMLRDEPPAIFWTVYWSASIASMIVAVSAIWARSMSPDRSDWRRMSDSAIGSTLIWSR